MVGFTYSTIVNSVVCNHISFFNFNTKRFLKYVILSFIQIVRRVDVSVE